jgi:hypothetical protein
MRRIYLLGFLTIIIVLFSCRKMDIVQKTPQNQTNTELAKKFFTIPASTNEAVARVANYIRAQNDVKGFAGKLIRFDGYALWDKAYIQASNSTNTYIKINSTSTNSSSGSANSADTIIYIPLVPENTEYVYSFIAAKVNGDDISWRLFSGRDYDTYPYGNNNSTAITADKIAMVSMILDYQTFGYTSFTVSDTKLFNSGNFSSNKPKQVKLTTRNVNTTNTLAGKKVKMNTTYMFIEYCFSYSYQYCPYNPCRGPGGTCDGCEDCTVSQTTCFEKMIALPSGGGGGGTVEEGPPPGGNGGPDGIPGNGDSPDDPCAINSPCGKQGWSADEALARNLMADLELNFDEKNWLADHPEHAIRIRDYLTNSPTSEPEKIELSKKHIAEMKNNPGYLQFVSNYAGNNPGAADMWWENDAWISDPANINFDVDGAYDKLNAAEKTLVKQHPVAAYYISKNKAEAERRTGIAYPAPTFSQLNDKADAYRHATFSAMNNRDCGYDLMGQNIAKMFGDAHETTTPSQLAMEKAMDQFNNNVGYGIGLVVLGILLSDDDITFAVQNKMNAGYLRYLSPLMNASQDPTFWGAQWGSHHLQDPDTATHGILSYTVLTPSDM